MDGFKVPGPVGSVSLKSEDPDKPSKDLTCTPPSHPVSNYVEPAWATTPTDDFSFEVLKNGLIIETFSNLERKSHWTFGRLPSPSNDIVLAHPTISRFHAVLQYKGKDGDEEEEKEEESTEKKTNKPEPGWYLYDLGSTHGTYINKQRIPSKTYVRLRVGYMIKMGASTRTFILLGPNHDEEDVKAESISEMKEQKQKLIEEMEQRRREEKLLVEERLRAKEEEGISWGMAEDADDEPDLSVNPFAVSTNEELFLDDPKKTLRGFFEREGLELEYKAEDLPNNTFKCRVELPIDDEMGRPIHAEVTHKGKKKECVVQCALEACRILDRHGVLRKANQEAAVRRRKPNSDSENDDDDFLDRTGDIEKRRKRKTAQDDVVRTFEELVEEEKNIERQIAELEEKIVTSKLTQQKKKSTAEGEADDLDDFMNNLRQDETPVDKVAIRRYRVEQQTLQKELKQVQKLIEITRPLDLPKIVNEQRKEDVQEEEVVVKKPKIDNESTIVKEVKKSEEELSRKEEFKAEKEELKKIISPIVIPERKEPPKVCSMPIIPPKVNQLTEEPVDSTSSPNPHAESSAEVQAKKKARQRMNRMRKQVRDNVDMEETAEEVEEKFTDWLPPTDQRGDGTTALNDKLGY